MGRERLYQRAVGHSGKCERYRQCRPHLRRRSSAQAHPACRGLPRQRQILAIGTEGDIMHVVRRSADGTYRLSSETRQSRTVLSSPPLAMNRPSGLNATPTTACLCPERVCAGWEPSTCHNLISRSKLPLTIRLLSGLNAIDHTFRRCPVNVRTRVPSAALHRMIDLSLPALANHFPSGLVATVHTTSEWPGSVCKRVPSATRQRRTWESKLPVISVCPSGTERQRRHTLGMNQRSDRSSVVH